MTLPTDQEKQPLRVLVSDPHAFALSELDVRVFGVDLLELAAKLEPETLRAMASGELKATAPGISEAVRKELITRVRAGEHLELELSAITFRQKDGHPNRNGLRFKASKLGKIARSWKGKPALVDHRSWSSSARIGTILDSELVELADGWAGFRQTLRVVKPEAVISVLDGTLDRFSVGWDPTGPVICTAHNSPVFEKCRCWPLDRVALDAGEVIAEYEFTSAEGDETSAVNTPAVAGTKIEDVRAALAARLSTPTRTKESERQAMPFPKLAAALTLAALTETDDERAAASVEEIKRGKLAAETARDAYKQRAESAEAELAAERKAKAELEASALAAKLDAVIEGAYRAGKLTAAHDAAGKRTPDPGEAAIRKMGAVLGVAELEAYVATLPTKVPLGQRRDELAAVEPAGPVPDAVLASTARQLGLDPKDVAANAALAAGGRRTAVSLIHTAGNRLTSADKEG